MSRSTTIVGAVVALLIIVGLIGLRVATTPIDLTPSPSPSVGPTPQPTFDPGAGLGRCPTGYRARPGEPSPEPLKDDTEILTAGEGDRCSFLTLYLAEAPTAGETLTLLRDVGVTAERYAETGITGPLRAISLQSGVEVPGILLPDGGYRFAISTDIPWKIAYRDPETTRLAALLISDDCPAPDANLIIRAQDRIRLVLRAYRYRDATIELCSRPLEVKLDVLVFRRDDFELAGELAPLPTPRPLLNPIRLGADAAASNWWSPEYIAALLASEKSRGQVSLFAIFVFLVGTLSVTGVGAFAVWLLFGSGEREPKRVKQRGKRRGRGGRVSGGPGA